MCLSIARLPRAVLAAGPPGPPKHNQLAEALISWKEANYCYGKIALLLSYLQMEERNRQSSLEDSGNFPLQRKEVDKENGSLFWDSQM